MRHVLSRSCLYAMSSTFLVLSLLQTGSAQVMGSNNYKMQSDSVNAGGTFSESNNYKLEDTAGELATGDATSATYNLRAGYQQMQEVYLSMTAIDDVTLTPSLGGLTGGTSTGSTSFVVTTDSSSGYNVTIQALNSPAMQNGANSIVDYTPSGLVPDFLFTTGANEAHMAYSAEGVDIAERFQDAGSVCGVAGSDTPNRCFDGLSTTPVEVVRRTSGNHPDGATTTILFTVGIGGNASVAEGVYTATTTITALSL
jgi:hypothetical protein